MKKHLLTAVATTVLSTSAMAQTDQFYLRGDVGANINTMQKHQTEDYEHTFKFKSKTSGSIDVGVGYHVLDNFRAELVYGHHFVPTMKLFSRVDIQGGTMDMSAKSKGKIETLMLKGYYDLYDFGAGKIFAGAGVGLAQVSEKQTMLTEGTHQATGDTFTVTDEDMKAKRKNNFAYSLAVGSSYALAEGVNLDLQYNWSNYGHAKTPSDQKYYTTIKRRGHAVKFGVRFDI